MTSYATRSTHFPRCRNCGGWKYRQVYFLRAIYSVTVECFLLGASHHDSPLGEAEMATRTEKVLIALIIAAATAVAATASETINYTYDARGRLVQVKHSGSVNNNVTANYQYDKADNRTNVNVTSPNPPPP
jgi:YD repeat-containing protein